MRFVLSFVAVLSACVNIHNCYAQDLAPRAYIITPNNSNAVTLSYSFYDGSILFSGAVPITGSSAKVHASSFTYSHSLKLFGRTANLMASVPYAVGNLQGTAAGTVAHAYRSGLLDADFRLSVNIKDGPAMNSTAFAKWRQKTILGVSLKAVSPTGQYSPANLVNYGANRWGFKPELGLSQRWSKWIFDAYAGMWFFTKNHEFFPGENTQSESSTGAFEGHLSYDFKPRLWFSLDGNFWFGGSTSVNGVQNAATHESNSRAGFTGSIPVTKHQSLKFSYSNATYIRYGGDFQSVSLAWQYSWLGTP